MRRPICIALLLCAGGVEAQQPRTLFTGRDAYWSAAALAASIALSTADTRVAGHWNDSTNRSVGRDRLARRFAKIQEGSLTLGNLAFYGIFRLTGADALADISFHAAEAVVVGSLASQLIRGPLGRSRPHVTALKDQYDFAPFKGFRDFEYRAFPSIHTASAFGVATVYALETNRRAPRATWIVAPIAYALAAGPGLSRMYTGQHWASDILAGAAMGTLAGVMVVRYNHDVRPGNRIDRFFLGRDAASFSFAF
jgi:membrane-associated phospholipid phosphatase